MAEHPRAACGSLTRLFQGRDKCPDAANDESSRRTTELQCLACKPRDISQQGLRPRSQLPSSGFSSASERELGVMAYRGKPCATGSTTALSGVFGGGPWRVPVISSQNSTHSVWLDESRST